VASASALLSFSGLTAQRSPLHLHFPNWIVPLRRPAFISLPANVARATLADARQLGNQFENRHEHQQTTNE